MSPTSTWQLREKVSGYAEWLSNNPLVILENFVLKIYTESSSAQVSESIFVVYLEMLNQVQHDGLGENTQLNVVIHPESSSAQVSESILTYAFHFEQGRFKLLNL